MNEHIQNIRDDFRRARHHVEDRLALGAPFDATVQDFFCHDEALMRDFVRDCRVECLRENFNKNRGKDFADALLSFIKQVDQVQKMARITNGPCIAGTPQLIGELKESLMIARLMRAQNYVPSALLVEERIAADFMPQLRAVSDRNHVRGLLMMHEMGL